MVDVREVIAEAIPCNIVYGRPQAADEIILALQAAGFRILGPDEVDPVTEAMVDAALAEWSKQNDRRDFKDIMRAALKAAMEAGR